MFGKRVGMITKVFGEKLENEIYHDREAAYVVLIVDDKIAVVKTSSGKYTIWIKQGNWKDACPTEELEQPDMTVENLSELCEMIPLPLDVSGN